MSHREFIRPRVLDAGVAASLLVLAQVEIWTAGDPGGPRGALAFGALVATAALVSRTRAPVASAMVAIGAVLALNLAWHAEGAWFVPVTLVAIYPSPRTRSSGPRSSDSA